MNYFEVFDPTKVPGERKLRATFSNDKVAALTDHFSNLLLELKIYLLNHQVMKPLDIYANLLSSRPDSLKHIFVLVDTLSFHCQMCEMVLGYGQDKNKFQD